MAKRWPGDDVDQPELEKSLTIFRALEGLAADERYAAMAVRCWPEMFTDYGCAACGPMGLMNEAGALCVRGRHVRRADRSRAPGDRGEPSFLADIVDMDAATDTSVLALRPCADIDGGPRHAPAAQIHSNRRMPLLQEFALKPGRVTAARFSQAKNETKLVVAAGEMISAPRASPAPPA